MATLKLADGRTVPIVKPHIGDQMDLERQMRATIKGYGPKEFRDDLKLASFQQAFSLFASLNRAGVPTTIHEVLELDMGELNDLIQMQKGDDVDDADEPGAESEGEQTTDPQLAPTGEAALDQ